MKPTFENGCLILAIIWGAVLAGIIADMFT